MTSTRWSLLFVLLRVVGLRELSKLKSTWLAACDVEQSAGNAPSDGALPGSGPLLGRGADDSHHRSDKQGIIRASRCADRLPQLVPIGAKLFFGELRKATDSVVARDGIGIWSPADSS